MSSIGDSPFYRVSTRALILVDEKLLLVQNADKEWEVPGGGWEHSESFEAAIQREVREEAGVEVDSISPILFTYRQLDKRGYTALRLAVRTTTTSTNFVAGDDMIGCQLFGKAEFIELTLCPGEGPIKDYIDLIWT